MVNVIAYLLPVHLLGVYSVIASIHLDPEVTSIGSFACFELWPGLADGLGTLLAVPVSHSVRFRRTWYHR